MIRSKLFAVAGLGALLSLAACGGGGSGPGTTEHTDMTIAQADAVGGGIATLINGAFAASSQFDIAADGNFTDPTLAPGRGATRKQNLVATILRVGAHSARAANPTGPSLDDGILGSTGCVPSHSNSTDTDLDGIPDDDLLTFTSTNCTYVNDFGVTVVVQGTVEIKDQGSIWGFELIFNSLSYTLTDVSSNTGSVIVGGTYLSTVSANAANAQEIIHVLISSNTGGSLSATASWAFIFTPNAPISDTASALPAGSLSINGHWNYSHNDDNWDVILSTPEDLVYDGSCATNPIFASGSLEGQIAIARTHGFHIVFNGCGETPTVSVLGGTT